MDPLRASAEMVFFVLRSAMIYHWFFRMLIEACDTVILETFWPCGVAFATACPLRVAAFLVLLAPDKLFFSIAIVATSSWTKSIFHSKRLPQAQARAIGNTQFISPSQCSGSQTSPKHKSISNSCQALAQILTGATSNKITHQSAAVNATK
jgi:hypothetical protein